MTWKGLVGDGRVGRADPLPVGARRAARRDRAAPGRARAAARRGFSLGLAATLTALGLLVVFAGSVSQRLRGPLSGRLAGAAPALSAAVIVAAGMLLTVRAIPGVLGA